MKMKDGRRASLQGRAHIDLDSDLAMTAEIYPGDTADGESMLISTAAAQETLAAIGSAEQVAALVGDKGYQDRVAGGAARSARVGTFIAERPDGVRHDRRDRPTGDKTPSMLNRRRMQRARVGH